MAPEPESRGLLATALLTAALAACGDGEEPPPPVEEAPVEAPPPPPEPEPVRAPPPPPAPTTGALRVSGTPGATVVFDGRELGSVPGEWEDLPIGEFPIRVEREGFHPLEATVGITGGRTRSLAADLTEMLGSIAVGSDVSGATVFLNRAFRGNTPVVIENLQPGSYTLTVSAEGYEVYSERVEVLRARVPVRVEFTFSAATLDLRVSVVHKHRFGSCEGILVATPGGFDYQTDHKDAFQLAFPEVEEFELDYLNNNLRLKVLGGRTYNFESPDENLDALFVFQRDISAFLAAQ